MKIEINQGCFGTNISIDDKQWKDLSLDEKKNLLKRFIDSFEDTPTLFYIFEDLINNASEFKINLEQYDICEQCGNNNYTLEYESK